MDLETITRYTKSKGKEAKDQPTFPHSKVDFAQICSQAKEIGFSSEPDRRIESAIFLHSVASHITSWKIKDDMNDCEFTLIHEESFAGPQIWGFFPGDILSGVPYPIFGTGQTPESAYENYKFKIAEKIASMKKEIEDMEITVLSMDDIIRFARSN
jgi:hypothetical protein